MTDPGPTEFVRSADGTSIAVFRSGVGPPLILVHGASADHTTFRVVGPRLARHFTLHAIDRRGRGASGDTEPYAIAREFEDVAAVADAVAAETGGPVPVFGHSYGGRTALGAALLTDGSAASISYEGAPTPPGASYHPTGLDAELAAQLAAGDPVAVLSTFMTRVVGMDEAELAAYRADPVWPLRVAAAPTIVRELDAEMDPAASLETLGRVRQPVLQCSAARACAAFREATYAFDARLADGRVIEIAGAKHAAHHTRPDAVVTAVRDFVAAGRHPCETEPMLEMGIVGWIVVGFIAGAISGRVMGGKTARGCLPNDPGGDRGRGHRRLAGPADEPRPDPGLHRRSRRRGLRGARRPARPERRQPVGLTAGGPAIGRSATIEP